MCRLNELLDELDSCAHPSGGQQRPAVSVQCARIAREMMLSHRIGRPAQFVDEILGNQTIELKAKRGDSRRCELGTDGCVFLWLGASAYEQPPFVVFIDPVFEDDENCCTETSPWDTGGLHNKGVLGFNLSMKQARDCINRYSLCPPEHREYLGAVLDRCFGSPSEYIEGRSPMQCYPGRHGENSGHAAAQTFETRVVDSLLLDDRVISILVDPFCLSGPDDLGTGRRIADFRQFCKNRDVRLVEVSGLDRDRLREIIVEEVNRILSERGVL